MPFEYERDDAQGRVVITFQGAYSRDEGFEIIQRHRDFEKYGVLYDLRGLTGEPPIADLKLLMTEESSGSQGSRGPIALVVEDPAMYKIACMYALLGRSMLTIAVFRDRNDADVWLAAQISNAPKGA